jgi:hypothetical protein
LRALGISEHADEIAGEPEIHHQRDLTRRRRSRGGTSSGRYLRTKGTRK